MTEDTLPAGASTRFAFLVGSGRCGSTLLQDALSHHPDVGFVSNVDNWLPLPGDLGRWSNDLYRRLPVALTQGKILRYSPSEGYRALKREVSPAIVAPFKDLTADDLTPWLERRFRQFFAVRAEAQRKPLFVHKFTGWPRVGFIQGVFPEARFVHVVRDGRAVANSLLQTTWWRGFAGPEAWGWGPLPEPYASEWRDNAESFVLLAGLHWKMLLDAAERARTQVAGQRWMQVKYEDLVEDPCAKLGEILAFLGLDWNEAFKDQVRKLRFNQSRTRAYETDLSPGQLKVLESSLAGHLDRLGYLS